MFRPITQYFVAVPWAAITALGHLGYDTTSLAHLYLGCLSHSSLQILSKYIYFQFSPEFDQVQLRALAGPLKDIQRLVPKPLQRCLGCVLRVVVLLEGEPSP